MIRMRNTTTDEVFPLYVDPKRSARQEFARYIEQNGTGFDPIECYDFNIDLENQVQADRTVNWDEHLSVQTGPITGVVPGPIGNEGPNMPNDDPDVFVGRNRDDEEAP